MEGHTRLATLALCGMCVAYLMTYGCAARMPPSAPNSTPATTAGVMPEIMWFDPEIGTAGTKVNVFGRGFNDVRAVTFDGVSATFRVDRPGRIVAIVPRSARDGNIAVTTRAGRTELDSPFRVLARPLSAQQMQSPPKLDCGHVVEYLTGAPRNPLFGQLIFALQKRTCVSVRLPTVIESPPGIVAVVDPSTSPNAYAVNLTFDRRCDRGQYVCTDTIVTGDYIGAHPPPLPGKPVKLADGTAAYYERSRAYGSYPSDFMLTWRSGEFQYSIASKGAGLKSLLDSANSMVLYSMRVR